MGLIKSSIYLNGIYIKIRIRGEKEKKKGMKNKFLFFRFINKSITYNQRWLLAILTIPLNFCGNWYDSKGF